MTTTAANGLDIEDGFPATKLFNQGYSYTYDDVIFLPHYIDFPTDSVQLTTQLTRNITLSVPCVASPMDTVTESSMAVSMAALGGIGIVHSNNTVSEQVDLIRSVKSRRMPFAATEFCFVSPDECISTCDVFEAMPCVFVTENGLKTDKKLLGFVDKVTWDKVLDKEDRVGSYMIKNVMSLSNSASLEDVAGYLAAKDLDFVPLVSGEGKVVDVVSDSDVERIKGYPKCGAPSIGKDGGFLVGASIGTRDSDKVRLESLVKAGVDVIVIDSSQGNSIYQIEMIKYAKKMFPDLDVIGGNVVTMYQAQNLINAGVDGLRVGMGSGSICTTQEVCAVGRGQVFWASVFYIPKSTVKDIERVFKRFLWCHGELTKGRAKIAWKEVCRPKDQGGLGLRQLNKWNETLLVKHVWNLATKKDCLWVRWINAVRLKGRNFWDMEFEYSDSWMWRRILELRSIVRPHLVYKIGNGEKVSVWYDTWNEKDPLCKIISKRRMYAAGLAIDLTVADKINNGGWNWPQEWIRELPALNTFPAPTLTGNDDLPMWRTTSGQLEKFTVKKAWEDLRENINVVPWKDLVWYSQGIPSHMFILWVAMHERLQTQDRVMRWSNETGLLCPLCNIVCDSHSHLFFQCAYAQEVWKNIKNMIDLQEDTTEWGELVRVLVDKWKNKSIGSVVGKLSFGASVYFIWNERNQRIFKSGRRTSQVIVEQIIETVKMRIMTLRVCRSSQVSRMIERWNVQPIYVEKCGKQAQVTRNSE